MFIDVIKKGVKSTFECQRYHIYDRPHADKRFEIIMERNGGCESVSWNPKDPIAIYQRNDRGDTIHTIKHADYKALQN